MSKRSLSSNNLPPAFVQKLTQLKQQLSADQLKRDALVEKGRTSYHLGIEERDCPDGDPSARKLWTEGWRLAKGKFETMFPPTRRQFQ